MDLSPLIPTLQVSYVPASLINSGITPDSTGTLYDNIAGVTGTVRIQTRDVFRNLITIGGHSLELALLGVAVQWGTEEPFTPLQGRANEYYYRGASELLVISFIFYLSPRLLRWISSTVRHCVRPRGRLLRADLFRPVERTVRHAAVSG